MKIVVIGAPGSGKGTLAQAIEEDFELTHLSVGAILRSVAKKDKNLAKEVSAGGLVNRETVKSVLSKRLKRKDCQKGFILDGYPRSMEQAQDLKEITDIDLVLYITITEKEVYNRLSQRLSCQNCGYVYNTAYYKQDICEKCGHKLEKRADDTPNTIKKRLDVFNKELKPILKFYEGKIVEVKNKKTPQLTYAPVKKLLKKVIGEKKWLLKHKKKLN